MPSNTTSSMFFVYVLESSIDRKRYIGYISNLRKRIKEHTASRSVAIKFRRPFKLIYYEACLEQADAKRMKTTQGRRFLGLRLKEHVAQQALGSGS